MERNQGLTGGDIPQGGMGPGLGGGTGDALLNDVDGVIGALQGGVTAVPVETAAGLVARIQTDLMRSGTPALHEVAQSLGQLQQALISGQLEGAGALLARLSAQVEQVAGQAPEPVGERLRTLASLLTDASEQLG